MANALNEDILLEILRLKKQEGLSGRQISTLLGVSKSSVNDFLSGKTHKGFHEKIKDKPIADGRIESFNDKRESLSGKVFLFSSAQNNTFVHDKALKSLLNYKRYKEANFYIGTFSYNLNGYQSGASKDEEWYDPKIREYILNESCFITKDLLWCGELSILPTADNPESGMKAYCGPRSGILPHAKQELTSIPTKKFEDTKMLYTTGCVTQRNYIPKKAGQKAEPHHVFGALIVEIDELGQYHVRQIDIEADTGCFYDLDKYVTPEGVFDADGIEAINWGDIHAAKIDDTVAEVSWRSKDSILDTLKPKYQFINDVFDMESRSHHGRKDQIYRMMLNLRGKGSVHKEIVTTARLLKEFSRDFSKTYVIESNHDRALERWLDEADYRLDDLNATYFLHLQYQRYSFLEAQIGERDIVKLPIFEYACKKTSGIDLDDVVFLREDDSVRICGEIECGDHGHLGNNGGKGSLRSFIIRGVKANIGHLHSAFIKAGVYVAGVSGKLDMKYNKGGSSWSQSHILTYPNGKRAIITIKKGKWRG